MMCTQIQEQQQDLEPSIWLWRSDYETWEMFSEKDIVKLEQAQASYSNSLILERPEDVYYIDIEKMTQTNTTTGRMRLLQRVIPGAQWIFEDSPATAAATAEGGDEIQSSSEETGRWTAFSWHENTQLEAALFAREDCLILERDAETVYVDLQRWSLTNLTTNTFTCAIKVATPNQGGLEPRRPKSITVPSSPYMEQGNSSVVSLADGDKKPAARKNIPRTSWMSASASEISHRTASTASAGDSDFSSQEGHPSQHHHHFANSNISMDDALWLWRNEEGLWSTFDDSIAFDIEASFSKGETGVVVRRGAKDEGSAYYLDLVEMTQTNMATGYVRNIERREDW